jgi:CRP-like cAMP-binding protein
MRRLTHRCLPTVAGVDDTLVPGCFLDRLTAEDRADLLASGIVRHYPAGSPFIHEGDDGDTAYLLLAGRVKVNVTTADGHESVLCVLGPGELLGEFEALDDDCGSRTASNVALTAVTCRMLRGAEFRAYLESHPRAAIVLLGMYVRRIRHSDRRRADSAALDTTHRVARLLLEQIDRPDAPTGAEIEVDLPLTQHELAGLVAASRESVVRALASLRSQGIISTARRRITIRNLESLRQLAG